MAAKAHGLSSDDCPATTDTSINETETGIVPTEGDTNAHFAPKTDVGSVGGVTTAGQNDLFRHFALVWLAVNLIDAAPRRVRRALKGQEEAVLKAVERYGFRIPILVKSKPFGERYEVIDGHMRLAAANRLAAGTVPCIVVDDLSDVETRRLALSLNRLQEAGEWDPDALRLEINEIIEISNDVRIPGFELPEIEAIRFGVKRRRKQIRRMTLQIILAVQMQRSRGRETLGAWAITSFIADRQEMPRLLWRCWTGRSPMLCLPTRLTM